MVNYMTPKEKTIIQNLVKSALQRNDQQDLENLAKNSDYALSLIIDALCKNNEIFLHIKNILKD